MRSRGIEPIHPQENSEQEAIIPESQVCAYRNISLINRRFERHRPETPPSQETYELARAKIENESILEEKNNQENEEPQVHDDFQPIKQVSLEIFKMGNGFVPSWMS